MTSCVHIEVLKEENLKLFLSTSSDVNWLSKKFSIQQLVQDTAILLEQGGTWKEVGFGKVEPPLNFSEKFDFPRIGRRTGGELGKKSTWRELFRGTFPV